MAVTMDEIEDFIEVYQNQGIEKVKDVDLRKAIRHFWNVASKPTVEDRIDTLKSEGWIEKVPHSDSWKINHDQKDDYVELFRKAGQ